MTNLLRDAEEPADINALDATPISNGRTRFDDETGIESADLTMEEIDRLRPLIYEQLAEAATETLFMKVHDAWMLLPDGSPLLSSRATRGAIYFLRNPLDVAVSYSHHMGCDVDIAIECMGNRDHALCDTSGGLSHQLRQRLFTWSGHVESWLDAADIPVHVMRYEDMQMHPLETFGEAVSFAGMSAGSDKIDKALRFSEFKTLQLQEMEKGFKEKSPVNELFFRDGRIEQWRERLTPAQVSRIIHDHGEVMRRFGYL